MDMVDSGMKSGGTAVPEVLTWNAVRLGPAWMDGCT